jgi:hypothetical protein
LNKISAIFVLCSCGLLTFPFIGGGTPYFACIWDYSHPIVPEGRFCFYFYFYWTERVRNFPSEKKPDIIAIVEKNEAYYLLHLLYAYISARSSNPQRDLQLDQIEKKNMISRRQLSDRAYSWLANRLN